MPNLTSVGITFGIPTSGTGTVSTIDNIPNLWDKGSGTGGSLTQRIIQDTSQLGPSIWDKGAGTGGSLTQRMIVDSSQLGSLGQTLATVSVPVVPATNWVYNAGYYVNCPVGTTSVLQSSTGAIGDYLDHVTVFPAIVSAGAVSIVDNATTLATWAGGGTTALLTLTPFTIYVGAVSRSGAWKITTGTSVTALAEGRFS